MKKLFLITALCLSALSCSDETNILTTPGLINERQILVEQYGVTDVAVIEAKGSIYTFIVRKNDNTVWVITRTSGSFVNDNKSEELSSTQLFGETNKK